eukprot:4844655-Pyramimonas_sp.AAC.1
MHMRQHYETARRHPPHLMSLPTANDNSNTGQFMPKSLSSTETPTSTATTTAQHQHNRISMMPLWQQQPGERRGAGRYADGYPGWRLLQVAT